MKEKLLEIRSLMVQEGMTDTMETFQQCFSGEMSVTVPNANDKEKGQEKTARKSGQNTHGFLKEKSHGEQMVHESSMQQNGNQNATCFNAETGRVGSEMTIYTEAVPKRISSSSEEPLELSDESLNNTVEGLVIVDKNKEKTPEHAREPTPLMARERAEQVIKDAEAAKVKIFPPKGNDHNLNLLQK